MPVISARFERVWLSVFCAWDNVRKGEGGEREEGRGEGGYLREALMLEPAMDSTESPALTNIRPHTQSTIPTQYALTC